jgi:hypothetical protein
MLSWADAVMLRSKTTPSRPWVAAKGLGISPVVRSKFRCEEFRLSRCGLAGLFQSRCAQQGHRRRERLNIAQTKAPQPAVRNIVYPFRVTANCSKWGAALNVAVGRVPSVCSRVLENGTNCGGRTKPSYLSANGASVVCPRREKRHAPAAMTIQRIKCRSYLLLPQPLPQPLSKLLPFPAILFVRPPSVRISLGGSILPRILGIVLMTVPRGNN